MPHNTNAMGMHRSDEDRPAICCPSPQEILNSTLQMSSPPMKSPRPNPILFENSSASIPPLFWGELPSHEKAESIFPIHRGYRETRDLIGSGNTHRLNELMDEAVLYLSDVFGSMNSAESVSSKQLARLRLSDELQQWREEQHALGKVLPSKGHGLKPVSKRVCKLLGADKWPPALVTHGALFGCGQTNLLVGAYDAPTLVSNYVNDLGFYYEHGYHKVFPEFDQLIKDSLSDPRALQTPAGLERRISAQIGLKYIKAKVHLEEQHAAHISNRSAIMTRRTAQILSLGESSLLGLAAEAIARGFDPAAVMADMVLSNPATDVVDVGRDLHNSEVMNSFLNTADVHRSDGGVVREATLRRVYDAYAHTGARAFGAERWMEPTARMCANLYTWHILNDRHRFFRLAVLGYNKCRVCAGVIPGGFVAEQREADFDEAFDERLHTTGFSRPLKSACDGGDPCDAVRKVVDQSQLSSLLYDLWWCLVTGPMEYVSGGQVDETREDELTDRLGYMLALVYSKGLFLELTWLCSHASQHAWQVNYMFEAAMFGSLLDDGALGGKLDRIEA